MTSTTLTPIKIRGPHPQSLLLFRDEHGTAHIHGMDAHDLAWGTGYCHGIDRYTQLLLMRVIGQGRLCELLSDDEDSLHIDCFFRRANWSGHMDSVTEALDPATSQWAQRYCDGVNAALRGRRFSVLRLLGVKPEPWRIEDCILLTRMTAYLTLAQSQAEAERFFVELAQAGIDAKKLAALFPIDADKLDLDLLKKVTLEERIVPGELLWAQALPRAMASNNWVISGTRTASGKPIMANDPHLEVNRLPNVWYEMSLRTPAFQGSGFGIPGLPSLLVGRTPDIAWGATYTFMDGVDSWIEHCRDGQFRRGDAQHAQWETFVVRTETIQRKKHPPHVIRFYENQHGVLDGTPDGESYRLCTRWAPARSGAQSLNASFLLMQAHTTEQAMQIMKRIETAWNWVIADSAGNIGYQMSGLMPQRCADWNGFAPAPGWDAHYDWQGFVDPDRLPRQFNPDCGYIVTANNDLNAFGTVAPSNMPMGDYRARRIARRIEAQSAHTVDTSLSIQLDMYSLQAQRFLEVLLPLLDSRERQSDAAEVLLTWDRHYDTDSIGAVWFERFYAALRHEVFGTRFGASVMQHLTQETGLFIDFYGQFDRCLLDANSPWYADRSQADCFRAAWQAMDKTATKTWGERNRITMTNMLFQGKLPRFLGLDAGPLALPGGRATPRQGQIYRSAGRNTSFAPSIRLIADMAETTLHTAIAGGPSDRCWSRWYKSGVGIWRAGELKGLG